MPTEITTSAHASPIKWTDDEWNKIAVQLYQLKGTDVLASAGVNDIKARDVFEAQNVLPAGRRRKHISIAQGFQQIRARLRGLFERGQQEKLFPTTAPVQTKMSRGDTPPGRDQAVPDVSMEEAQSFHTATGDLFGEGGLVRHASSEGAGNAHPLEESSAVDVPRSQEHKLHSSRKSVEQRAGDGPQSATIAPTTSAYVNENVQPSVFVKNEYGQSSRQAELPSASLTALVRPFVAMVCEEFARALVQTFSEEEIFHSLASRLQPAVGRTAHSFEEPRSGRNPHRPNNDHQSRSRNNGLREASASTMEAREGGHDEFDNPSEVQPLFDPKLPPSANSDFKPMIGLVATRDHEYEDLQLLYPQLRFSIVSAQDIHGPEAFRDCQRVIGLRGEVPHTIEELLKRALGYRYIWLRGGMDRIREQLDSWLANPRSIQAKPRSAKPRMHTGSRNGNVKKQGKWPPRVA